MKTTKIKTGRALALLVVGLLATAGAMAEKPDWAGGGNPAQGAGYGASNQAREGRNGNPAQNANDRPVRVGAYFVDTQRAAVSTYYGEQSRAGRCPPGLAKKNNGCMPPGQARKWAVGQPLPRDVVYYSLPQSLVVQLGVPPPEHRYVRVASDILLIAVGTGMVVDAIQDLGQR